MKLDIKKPNFTAKPIDCSCRPLRIDESLCVGCNSCVNICQIDVFMPSDQPGKPPLILYPGECWYCGRCVMSCKTGALTLRHPVYNESFFKRSERADKT